MSSDPTTVGYEPEPQDVAVAVAAVLDGWDDPVPRYSAATAAQVFHQAVAEALAAERGRILAGLNSPAGDGGKMSYAQIGHRVGLSRGRVQQLVERARATG